MIKNIGKNISKNLSSKCSLKLLNHVKQSVTDTFKTTSKKVIQNKVEATGDLISNKLLIKLQKSQLYHKIIYIYIYIYIYMYMYIYM